MWSPRLFSKFNFFNERAGPHIELPIAVALQGSNKNGRRIKFAAQTGLNHESYFD